MIFLTFFLTNLNPSLQDYIVSTTKIWFVVLHLIHTGIYYRQVHQTMNI